MRDLFGHRPAGAVLVGVAEGSRGRILRANRAFAALVGSTPDALVGSRVCDHFHPSDRARALEAFLRLIDGSRSYCEGSCSLLGAGGKARLVSVYASMVAAGANQLILIRVHERPA